MNPIWIASTGIASILSALVLYWVWNHLRPIVALYFSLALTTALAVGLLPLAALWGFVLAALPAVIILQHAVFLYEVRSPFGPRARHSRLRREAGDVTARTRFQRALDAARARTEVHFSPSMLALRLGVPAVLMLALGIAVVSTLFPYPLLSGQWPDGFSVQSGGFFKAARYGAVGAYVFVLLNLGHRNFRSDITNGGAMWSAVTLALGPILAWGIAHFWTPSPAQSSFSQDSIFFLAGLSPRYVASAVEESVRRVWLKAATVQVPGRIQPVTLVRGITPEVQDRLSEEGIIDITSLAMADPLRILRSTSFELKQIVSWMDEALLIYYAPSHWEELEKQDFSGAIDLAWLAGQYPRRRGAEYDGQSPGADANQQFIQSLAKSCGFSDAEALASLIDRLYEDSQVQLIWALYHLGADEATIDGAGTDVGPTEGEPSTGNGLMPAAEDELRDSIRQELFAAPTQASLAPVSHAEPPGRGVPPEIVTKPTEPRSGKPQ